MRTIITLVSKYSCEIKENKIKNLLKNPASGGIPAIDVPPACIPWYPFSRNTITILDGLPCRVQNRRDIFNAVSILSLPPDVKKIFEYGTGEIEATKSASSIVGAVVHSPNDE